jgi:hypothetical protein
VGEVYTQRRWNRKRQREKERNKQKKKERKDGGGKKIEESKHMEGKGRDEERVGDRSIHK